MSSRGELRAAAGARRTKETRRRPRGRNRRRRMLCSAYAVLLSTGILIAGSMLMGARRNETRPSAAKPQSQSSQEEKAPESGRAASAVPSGMEASDASDSWKLLLVNPWNALPEGYEVRLTRLKNGHAIDERCYPDLQNMMDDCRAGGLSPVICSSYRTQEKQESLFQNQVVGLIAQGFSEQDARREAAKAVAVPGTSEHQLGLAVDIVDLTYQILDETQEKTAVQKWLIENSWKYGFILRYPNDKREITGIIYEPWHYRYVGKAAAKEINERGICLEEYLKDRPSR